LKVFLTGATGFLGRYAAEALRADGHEVRALTRSEAGAARIRALGCEVVRGDIVNRDSIRAGLSGCEVVFHLAGITSSDPRELEATNAFGTRNITELCLEFGVGRLLHVSSAATIGASPVAGVPLDENSHTHLRGRGFPNYESKARGEEIVLEMCTARGLNAVIVNPSVVVGPGDALKPARRGEILASRGEMRVYPPGGLSVAPVRDVARGIVEAAYRGRKGERYLLGGENLEFGKFLALYSQAAGARAPEHRIPPVALKTASSLAAVLGPAGCRARESTASALLYHWYDSSKAMTELGYRPGPASEAIAASVAWMKENGILTVPENGDGRRGWTSKGSPVS
jgi:dihydroflavonol-4-reductase